MRVGVTEDYALYGFQPPLKPEEDEVFRAGICFSDPKSGLTEDGSQTVLIIKSAYGFSGEDEAQEAALLEEAKQIATLLPGRTLLKKIVRLKNSTSLYEDL